MTDCFPPLKVSKEGSGQVKKRKTQLFFSASYDVTSCLTRAAVPFLSFNWKIFQSSCVTEVCYWSAAVPSAGIERPEKRVRTNCSYVLTKVLFIYVVIGFNCSINIKKPLQVIFVVLPHLWQRAKSQNFAS